MALETLNRKMMNELTASTDLTQVLRGAVSSENIFYTLCKVNKLTEITIKDLKIVNQT